MVRPPRIDCNGMKKGAWSEEEDEKLRNYIMRYGHWNWRLLPKYAGLARCGKSCRLRWMNYLKPGIKRGNFSKQEQDLVVELHAKLGNKWAAIAAKLPGRSDNEIKNFWKTHIERRRNRKYRQANVNTKLGTSIEQDSVLELQDSSLSLDTESSDTVENPQVDFWTDIILESDTAYGQMNLLPPLQEEDFSKYNYNEFSGSFVHDPINEDFWPGENGYGSENIEGFYDPSLEYFDYGMDLFN